MCWHRCHLNAKLFDRRLWYAQFKWNELSSFRAEFWYGTIFSSWDIYTATAKIWLLHAMFERVERKQFTEYGSSVWKRDNSHHMLQMNAIHRKERKKNSMRVFSLNGKLFQMFLIGFTMKNAGELHSHSFYLR